MISTTFGWHLPRSHSGIAPDNTILIYLTHNQPFQIFSFGINNQTASFGYRGPETFSKGASYSKFGTDDNRGGPGTSWIEAEIAALGPIFLPDLLLLVFSFRWFWQAVSEASAWNWSCHNVCSFLSSNANKTCATYNAAATSQRKLERGLKWMKQAERSMNGGEEGALQLKEEKKTKKAVSSNTV